MKNNNFFVLTLLVGCFIISCKDKAGEINDELAIGANQELNTVEIVKKYSLSNKKFENIYYDLETILEFGNEKRERQVYSLQYCSQNRKKQWIGHSNRFDEDGAIDQKSSSLVRVILVDKQGVCLNFYNPELENLLPPGAILISDRLNKFLQDYSEHPPFGGSISGRFWGNNGQSISDLLESASNLKSTDNVTKIMGHNAFLIEAETQYGNVKAWISPDLDYNCLKWEIEKTPKQYYRDGMPSNDSFTKSIAVYDAEKADKIDGRYIITQAKLNYKVIKDNETLSNDTYHFNLKNIDLNPDYEALRAFEIQLPEGTIVYDDENPDVRYQWIDGNLVQTNEPTLAKKPIEDVSPSVSSERKKQLDEQDILTVSRSNLKKHVEELTALESRYTTHPGNEKAAEYIINELKKYGYLPVEDSVEVENKTLFNVISDSSDKKKPVILLSAHFDSISYTNRNLSSQAPGADDNASGVAALLELARILKENNIQKNFEFVFFNCEENGKLDSKHLSDKYRDNDWQIEYMINIDTIGTWEGPLSKTCPVNYVTDENSKEIVKQLEERFPYPLQKAKTLWRDDHASFWNNGFKAIEITEDGCTQHMHKPTDTDEKLNYDNIARIVHGLYMFLSQ
ncbi:MAG: M20/M25/M40 family metallo-hydrolase [Sedimentisphaerales bacterium]